MKRILNFLLIGVMIFSMIPTTHAFTPVCEMCGSDGDFTNHNDMHSFVNAQCQTCGHCSACADNNACSCSYCEQIDYENGTQVEYNAAEDNTIGDNNNDGSPDNVEYYTVTVPALLTPGSNGNVTAKGTWASNRKLSVTADKTVTLVNTINSQDEKILNVDFLGISLVGNNTVAVENTQVVSVSNIANALFGTWSGIFHYNVEMKDVVTLPAGYVECNDFSFYSAETLSNGMTRIPMNQNAHYGDDVYLVVKDNVYLAKEYHAGDINPSVAGTFDNGQCYGNPALYNFYSSIDKGLDLEDSGEPFFWMHFDGQGSLIIKEGYTIDDFTFYHLG